MAALTFQQDHLNRLVRQRPTGTLFHYTTQAGLKGIVESKSVWATHHQCLNDSKEFSLCRELLERELHISRAYPKSLRDEIRSNLTGAGYEDVNLYLASFTEQPDSLSQWRGYGGDTSAFSLGFNLGEVNLHRRFRFAKCIYKPKEQRKVLHAIIAEYAAKAVSHPGSGASFLRFCFHTFALMLKDESFEQESEWRIISEVWMDHPSLHPPVKKDACPLGFRPGRSMLIPYRTLALTRADGSFALTEVRVGPSPVVIQSERSVMSFLNSQGLASVQVTRSRVPYRTW
jgi:hypothetical protein